MATAGGSAQMDRTKSILVGLVSTSSWLDWTWLASNQVQMDLVSALEITSTVVNVKSRNSGAILLVFEDSIEMNATNTTAAGQYSGLSTISNICSDCNAKQTPQNVIEFTHNH